MAEPRQGDGAVGRLVISQFANHTALCPGMRKHIDEVEHHDIQVVLLECVQLLHQFIGISRIIHLVIGKGVTPAIAFQLSLNERFFIQVLTFFLFLVNPQVRKHLCNLIGHQPAKNGITSILCSSGQNAEIQVFVYVEEISYLLTEHTPLVIAEVIHHDEEHLLPIIKQGEHLRLENVRREDGLPHPTFHPIQIVGFDKL